MKLEYTAGYFHVAESLFIHYLCLQLFPTCFHFHQIILLPRKVLKINLGGTEYHFPPVSSTILPLLSNNFFI